MTFVDNHNAQAMANANLHHLANEAGVVLDQTEAELIGRISERQKRLATKPLTDKQRRDLYDANELDEQQIALMHDRCADHEANSLARAAYWLAIAIAALAGLWNLLARNWGG